MSRFGVIAALLLMLGLFQRHTGSKANEILCRHGHIAMMPTEPVVIDGDGNTGDVHLMEVRSIGEADRISRDLK